MPGPDEWFQGRLDVDGEPGEDKVKRPRRELPIKQCQLCKKPVVQPWFSGSHDPESTRWYAGQRIKLDPVAVPDGEFFTVHKTAHRRLPTDLHPSLVFYNEHVCIAESK